MVAPVVGGCGDFSPHAHNLADLIAEKRARSFCGSYSLLRLSVAKGMFMKQIYRSWGLIAHRMWAHMLIQRAKYVRTRSINGNMHVDTGDGELNDIEIENLHRISTRRT